ncbi:hypothetical protein WDL1P2_00049 (plasmid) [Variovorax sp. WDL1]|nr:hypothetical protein CHC06_06627 [Variovorax sp. B2]PNG49366.1 hypothetical protein CHC07_06275 [Variovorax sp. B4]VTV18338.1 hypothetical protein WDL1P2_00049 [Variovorax sp. WDL1]
MTLPRPIKRFLSLAALTTLGSQSFAFCMAPSPPVTPSNYSSTPQAPICISGCDSFQAQQFTNSVKSAMAEANTQIEELVEYKRQLVRYHNEMIDYMNCENRRR